MWFRQTILSKNFPTSLFPYLSPSYPLPFSYMKKQVLRQPNANKISNFWQFQMELIGWSAAPGYNKRYKVETSFIFFLSKRLRRLRFPLLIMRFFCNTPFHFQHSRENKLGSKGIRKWSINWCTFPMMIHKITPCVNYI